MGRLGVVLGCSGTLPGRSGSAFRPIGVAKSLIFLRFLHSFDDAVLPLSWGRLGPSWGRLGAVFGPSWAVLGPSRGRLGPSWGNLGPSWGRLGPSWAVLGASWARLGPLLSHLGSLLGPSWAVLGPSWGPLGARSWSRCNIYYIFDGQCPRNAIVNNTKRPSRKNPPPPPIPANRMPTPLSGPPSPERLSPSEQAGCRPPPDRSTTLSLHRWMGRWLDGGIGP